ncbi:hypothetical protein [Rubrolithibacter danxiaensis]|uniref:hypothetical protein n=1 Tax=Rubrolithibacter danxiaensis TaxID=3390805 RepID=UPI003BF88100
MKHLFDIKEEAVNRDIYYWMNKYISLLEKYNELLLQQSLKEEDEFEKRNVAPSKVLLHNQPISAAKRSKQN